MKATITIENTEDIIDSRDVIARIEHLESEFGDPSGLSGCFDGLRGLEITMTLEQAQGASHAGQCDEYVAVLVKDAAIAEQLDTIGADEIRDLEIRIPDERLPVVTRYMDGMGLGKCRARRSTIDPTARAAGRAAGHRVTLTRASGSLAGGRAKLS